VARTGCDGKAQGKTKRLRKNSPAENSAESCAGRKIGAKKRGSYKEALNLLLKYARDYANFDALMDGCHVLPAVEHEKMQSVLEYMQGRTKRNPPAEPPSRCMSDGKILFVPGASPRKKA
jgi:hypothetical protein